MTDQDIEILQMLMERKNRAIRINKIPRLFIMDHLKIRNHLNGIRYLLRYRIEIPDQIHPDCYIFEIDRIRILRSCK